MQGGALRESTTTAAAAYAAATVRNERACFAPLGGEPHSTKVEQSCCTGSSYLPVRGGSILLVTFRFRVAQGAWARLGAPTRQAALLSDRLGARSRAEPPRPSYSEAVSEQKVYRT